MIVVMWMNLSGCSRSEPPKATLTVCAAASLTEAFGDLARTFESRHPQVRVVCNFAGTQQLLAQLKAGARADVFASANTRYMDEAISDNLVNVGVDRVFARNRLVIVQSRKSEAKITSVADLAQPKLRVVIADAAVPVGKYTQQMLAKAGDDLANKIQANVISRELDVKAVLAKVRLGEADAGVVYASDVTSGAKADVTQIAIPDAINVIAEYPIAPLSESAHEDYAAWFVNFVLSDPGQKLLAAHGLTPMEQAP